MKTRRALAVVAVILLLAPVVLVLGTFFAIPLALLFVLALPILTGAVLAAVLAVIANTAQPVAEREAPPAGTVVFTR